MSGPAPYWGQLPAPTVSRGNSGRRGQSSSGRTQEGDKHTASDTRIANDPSSFPAQSTWRSNRISSQTVKTDAPTMSTQSPFVSPVASEFRGDGLAPRPPSFPYGASDTNQDFSERRKRRESRNREQNAEYETIDTMPAAPDVPRAPPISYKMPYGNGAPPTNYQVPPKTRRGSDVHSSARNDVPDEPYRSNTIRTREASVDEELVRTEGGASRGKGAVRRGPSQRGPSHPNHIDVPSERKGSLNDVEALKRTAREWAPDRSPLQRLELTLDSITKEEKRARIEEAELVARENKGARGGDKATQNSVRFRNRPVAKAPHEPLAKPEPQNLGQSGLARSPSSPQKDQLQRSGTVERKRPQEVNSSSPSESRGFESGQRQPSSDANSKRDTGRDAQRSTDSQNRAYLPGPATGDTGVVTTVTASPLGRSGSNKLKKNPPGDPWFNTRQEGEKKYPAIVTRTPSGRVQQTAEAPSQASRRIPPRSYSLDKELPVLPSASHQVSNRQVEFLDPDSDDPEVKSMRRGTLSKIQKLTGEKFPTQQPKKTEKGVQTQVVTIDGVKYTIPPSSEDDTSSELEKHGHHHHLSNILHRHEKAPVQALYKPSQRLDEWKKGGVALLSGTLLDLDVDDHKTEAEKDKAWWEAGNTGRRRSSTKQRKAEAYDGEYENSTAPTRFKPPLFLQSGPMLRYCGIRKEAARTRPTRPNVMPVEQEIWRGSVVIVTQDAHSSYELAPTLRLFLQPRDLLPPPPEQVAGEDLAPEYIDPIAGLPKIGRDGRTLYVRPVEDLAVERDLSREESDDGIYEMRRSTLEGGAVRKGTQHKPPYDGEKAGKYKEVRGFRLHAEHGATFWRFNLEIELREQQQRIAYRINRGPTTAFWVPARGQAMNIMFHSCNGFSANVDSNKLCGPDPMWRDVLNTHQTQPFHVMLGGGDQIYNDLVMYETTLYKKWTERKNPHHREEAPFTPELQMELESFYLDRYCMWFSQGLFGLAVSQIPMINMLDDHDIIDGFGSYPDDYMSSPIFSGLGAVAFKYYMLFQHQSSIDEGEETEPSWLLGLQPGPYIREVSRSIFTHLGRSIAFLALDCRTERMFDEVVSAETYHKVFDRLAKEIVKGETKHLIVLLGIPVAYPRMVWLENILTSKAFEPVKAMGRAGLLGPGLLNRMDGGVEILDDLNDHWTARKHKEERKWLIEELQDLAAEKSVRVTILGGDVHLAAVGQFYSNPKLGIPKDRDFRYMPNVISSAIVNTPPPDSVADLLNKRNKVHHLDSETDEDMIPIFTHDVNGKPRNNKRLLNRRNWCSIRSYNPSLTPPQTPFTEGSVTPPPRQSLLRRLSGSRGPRYAPDAVTSPPGARHDSPEVRPPLSNTQFFNRQNSIPRRGSAGAEENFTVKKRSLSLSRKDILPGLLRRLSSKKRRPDDGGINGYGAESEDEDVLEDEDGSRYQRPSGIRGGAGFAGAVDEDDSYFPTMPSPLPPAKNNHNHNRRPSATTAVTAPLPLPRSSSSQHHHPSPSPSPAVAVRPSAAHFHRTPTGLSQKQIRKGGVGAAVDLEEGLEICLNVEISARDPAGTTVPYRLLVPRLWYEEGERGTFAERGGAEIGAETGGGGEMRPGGSGGGGTMERAKSVRGGLVRLLSGKGK